jgi:hypothetical protein
MKKLVLVLCLTLGGCASMPPVHMPKAIARHHYVKPHVAPVAAPVVVAPAPAPVEAPKPVKRKRWLDYLRSFKKDKTNG